MRASGRGGRSLAEENELAEIDEPATGLSGVLSYGGVAG
jgi:hypothetical protein